MNFFFFFSSFFCPFCSCHLSCLDNWQWYDPLHHIGSKPCPQKDFFLMIDLSCRSSSCSSFYWISWQKEPFPHPILLTHFLLHFCYLELWMPHFSFSYQFLPHELHLEISWQTSSLVQNRISLRTVRAPRADRPQFTFSPNQRNNLSGTNLRLAGGPSVPHGWTVRRSTLKPTRERHPFWYNFEI